MSEAPFKFAVRDMGPVKGVQVFMTKNEPGMQDAVLIMSLNPMVAYVPGVKDAFYQFVSTACKLLVDDVLGEGIVSSVELREVPKVN